MHTHSLPVSRCAHHQPEEIPQMFLNNGMQAIVLTNHYYPAHCDRLSDDLAEQARIYIDTFHRCKTAGEKIGLKVFFGSEIKLINEPDHPEFLLYGLAEKDFLESYPMYNATQKELFDFCNEKNIIMVQSHPYRTAQGYAPADVRYLHGVEAYNGHPHFDTRFEDCIKLVADNGKIKTAGSDFHVEMQAGSAGMIVPDEIEDQFMLRDYLRTGECILFNKDGILLNEKSDKK